MYAFVLAALDPDFYYFSIQEDEYLEWSTFWAFLVAAVLFLRAAPDFRRKTHQLPWFLFGVAVFCFVVAMEEISWGQRIIGYRPPVYFLEHNFQQEFNIHNVVDADYRKLALTFVIAGYGIVLPIAARFAYPKSWFDRLGVVAPPVMLIPAYAGAFLLYVLYPLDHSGEWVELMLGTSFLFGALADARRMPSVVAIAYVALISLGLVSGAASRRQRDEHPATLQSAAAEVDALARDFESGLAESRCNLHKRLYTFVEEYDQDRLLAGSFSALQGQGLPAERAEYFLDPWNSPYWLRDRCDRATNKPTRFVYSFGPNRRRDSTSDEILGDDIGAYIELDR